MVHVNFFAGLAEQVGFRETTLEAGEALDVAGVWQRVVGSERPSRLRCARNLEHCDFGEPVRDGDEIAFFPPVTGG
jgi:sulfur-carrier protein